MLPFNTRRIVFPAIFPSASMLVVGTAIVFCSANYSQAQPENAALPDNVRARLEMQTPVSDELLHELEKDFVELLQQSSHPEKLLEAEKLLVATNDNTHWTNYSSAIRILRSTHDIAAIPLLLRYIVLHTERSNGGSMISEYCKAISLISGCKLEDLYVAGPDLESRMRTKVHEVVNNWWREAKGTLVTDPAKMDDGQLQVIVTHLLEQVRRDGDFTGSGGDRDSAYGAYHNVNYRLLSDDATSRNEIGPLCKSMVPMVLGPSGYRTESSPKSMPDSSEFPYEAVVILAELAKNGFDESVQEIAADEKQNSTVRMVCALALYRAGYPYETDLMLKLAESEKGMEFRLTAILTLRWGGEKAVPFLLQNMNDGNIEIATSAACALVDVQPPEAIPIFRRMLNRDFSEVPLMLFSALSEFKSPEAREILKDCLTDAVEGKRNSQHLYRILNAFAESWEVPRDVYYDSNGRDYKKQALLALNWCHEKSKKEIADRTRLVSEVESLKTQLAIAEEIETMRRNEYKRLLGLQGDEIVTAEASQNAHELLKMVSAEVESVRTVLRAKEIDLEALKY